MTTDPRPSAPVLAPTVGAGAEPADGTGKGVVVLAGATTLDGATPSTRRRVLAAAADHPTLGAADLARMLRISQRVVRYHLQWGAADTGRAIPAELARKRAGRQWMARAACAGGAPRWDLQVTLGPAGWEPSPDNQAALRTCQTCPVMRQCARHARATGAHGVIQGGQVWWDRA